MEKIFTVDKFLGLNESGDGSTELKMGEASKIENFYITDGYNLKSRPGVINYTQLKVPSQWGETISGMTIWTGYICGKEYALWTQKENEGNIHNLCSFCPSSGKVSEVSGIGGAGVPVAVFSNDSDVFFLQYWEDKDMFQTAKLIEDADGNLKAERDNTLAGDLTFGPYIPLVISGCTPDGGGTVFEPLNILTNRFRVAYTTSTDTTKKKYVLPDIASGVISFHIGGVEYPADDHGTFQNLISKKIFTFNETSKIDLGVEMVFVCTTDDADLKAARERFLRMPYWERFNGATDKRIFFYGDGTNVSYYTGNPTFIAEKGYGDGYWNYSELGGYPNTILRDGTHQIPTLYIPAGNELAVDYSDSPITAMARHYSRLLVYKPDGVDQISYEPITLADGTVTAGFYMTPVNRNFGNDAPGQVVQVNNSPRSFTHKSIYEWRVSSGYQDERYAKCISQKVAKTIAGADISKLIAFDDEADKTYYVFLNDESGTVLVNRYDLDVWSIYRSELTKNVDQCLKLENRLLFLRNGKIYCFDWNSNFDVSADEAEGAIPIECVWESGFMAFGADHKRKYSSNIWVSMLPESNSQMEVNVETDRREEDAELVKVAGRPLLDFRCLDFSNCTFLRSFSPKIKRIKMKVKKFVYYKLIFRVKHPGARATVLGYDQQVRYSSNVK